MKQLAGGKHMENDCFPRTLKFEILIMYVVLIVIVIKFTIRILGLDPPCATNLMQWIHPREAKVLILAR
jgi:hypothetical protein